MKITDKEVRILASISRGLEVEYSSESDDWDGSPFQWLKSKPSRQIGAIGEKLVSGWLAARGFNIARSPDSEADRIIESKRVEIKCSTKWKSGTYKFQQIRNQNYDMLICLGLSPFDAHCWVFTKEEIMGLWDDGHVKSQHGGAAGRDTAWLDIDSGNPPVWTQDYGGNLSNAIAIISKITGYKARQLKEELESYELDFE